MINPVQIELVLRLHRPFRPWSITDLKLTVTGKMLMAASSVPEPNLETSHD